MEKLKELVALMTKCHETMESLSAKINEASTDEERDSLKKQYEAKTTEFDSFKAKVADAKAQMARRQIIAEANQLAEADHSEVNLNPAKPGNDTRRAYQFVPDPYSDRHFSVDADPVRDARLKKNFFLGFMRDGAQCLQSEQLGAIAANDSRITRIATNAVMLPRDMAGMVRAQVCDGKLQTDPFLGKTILSTDATGGATDSGAANLIAPDFRPQLLTKEVSQPSIYDYCRLITAVNGTAEWPKLDQSQGNFGGVAFTWKATEGADKGETEPVFTDFTVSTVELSGWTEMSLTALRRSAISLEATLTQLFRDACRYEWGLKILRGTGTNQPQGIITDASVGTVNRAVASQVSWNDLVNLEYTPTQGLRVGGRYMVNDDVEKYLKGKLDTQNRPLFTNSVNSSVNNLLGGYEYTAHEYGPALGTKGDVVFGNFQQYAFAMEEDIAIARSEHAEFKAGKVVIRLICFVGGKPIYSDAFAILDVPST